MVKKVAVVATLLMMVTVANAQRAMDRQFSEKTFGVEFSPILLLIGAIQAQGTYAVNENVDINLGLLNWNATILDTTVKASGASLGARYSFDGVFNDGWYLGAGGVTGSATATTKSRFTNETLEASSNGTNPYLAGGYAWNWESFFIRFGLRLTGGDSTEVKVRNSNGTEEKVQVRNSNGGLEFNLGWAF